MNANLHALFESRFPQNLSACCIGMQEKWDAAFAFLDTQDCREGVQSFLDKIKPVFTGE